MVPATAPHARHQARIAANLCQILARQADVPDAFELPLDSLDRALGLASGLNDTSTGRLEAIALAISSVDDATAEAIHDDVAALVKGKIDVAKPGYDNHDAAAEAHVVA